LEASEKIGMAPNAASPVDLEVTSIAASSSIQGDITVNFSEG
jgi:hypothetical protein